MGAEEYRKLRRRSEARDDFRRVGGIVERECARGESSGEGIVHSCDRRKRRGIRAGGRAQGRGTGWLAIPEIGGSGFAGGAAGEAGGGFDEGDGRGRGTGGRRI